MGRKTSDEIRKKSKVRAWFLLEYLENEKSISFIERKQNFFRWFGEEQYAWYAILVMEECIQLVKENGSQYQEISEEMQIAMRMVLAGLYKNNHRIEQWKRLCEETVQYYHDDVHRQNLSMEYQKVLQNFSLVTADEYLLAKKDLLNAGKFYHLFLHYGGKASASVEMKLKTCEPYINEKVVQERPIFRKVNLIEEPLRKEEIGIAVADDTVTVDMEREFEELTNCYVIGNAVNVKQSQVFVGRKKWLNDYSQKLRDGTDGMLVFFGQCRVGKTSLLLHLQERLQDDFFVVSVPITSVNSESGFLSFFMKKLSKLAKNEAITNLKDKYLSSKNEGQKGRRQITEEDFAEFMEEVQDILHRQKDKKQIVLFLDEFVQVQNIPELKTKGLLLPLLSRFVQEGFWKVVITGSLELLKCIEENNSLFTKSHISRVEYLPKSAVIELFENPMKMSDGTSRYPNKKVFDKIYALTKGHPLLSQVLAENLLKKLSKEQKNFVTEEILDDLVNDLISNQRVERKVWFEGLFEAVKTDEWDANTTIGVCAKLQNATEQGIGEKEFLRKLSQIERKAYHALCDWDVIQRDAGNDRAYVYVELFGKWCQAEI